MFKSWRRDKNKIKAVFKLQFQATQVPRLKKSAVMISLVPEDVGKTTFKLEKVPVKDGTCTWENPIYVSVKLIKDPKAGKINEKIYHFAVSTGSSKSGFLGEASIDFADFVAETEPLTVSLPLKFANSGAILHVTIQSIQGAINQRCTEENGRVTLQNDGSLRSEDSNCDADANDQNFEDDAHLNVTAGQDARQNVSFRASTGSDATLASCWDNRSEPSLQDVGLQRTTTYKQSSACNLPDRQNSMPPRGTIDGIMTKKNLHRRSSTDWSGGSASDGSFVESTNSPDDDFQRGWQEESDGSVDKLKSEITILMRQVEISELELQSLRKQVMKESRRTQDQSKQILSLKEERDALHAECEQLKLQKQIDDAKAESQLQSVNQDSVTLLEEMKEELNCEKDITTNLRFQLQKTQDSNSNLILAVRDLNEMLEQKNKEISSLANKLEKQKNFEEVRELNTKCNINEDKHQQALRESANELNDAEEVDTLKQTIIDLSGEIEFYRRNNEELEMQLKQLMQDNGTLKLEKQDISFKSKQQSSDAQDTIKELESRVQMLEDKIKQQSEGYSESLISINELESQVKGLKKETEEQARAFEDDLDATIRAKTEQEQRAIHAEEALRKTRWRNAVTAERLQEEFKRLSVDMASKLDENEKLAQKAVAETNELRTEKRRLEEMLQQANKELEQIRDQNEVKLEELSHQLQLKEKQIEEMSWELDKRSEQLKYAQKHGEKRHDAFSMEMQTKTEIGEKEILTQRWNSEREEWEKRFASAKEAEKAQEQLIAVSSLKETKDILIEEVKEKELQKQVCQLKGELQKQEIDIVSKEKKLTNNCGEATVIDANLLAGNNSSIPAFARKKEARAIEDLKLWTSNTSKDGNPARLLDELAILKERNKSMEIELKEMQERYSEISLKFAEVEGERQQLVMVVRNLKNGKKN